MRTIIYFALVAILAFTSTAFARSDYGGKGFALYSAASAAVKTSAAVNVSGFRTKSMQVSGATITSTAASTTFKNMSGTVLAQCSMTSNGPWVTCVQQDSTAVSFTTNGILSWDDAFQYIRLQWTSGTVGTKLKAWFSWLEN